ncbi:Endoplasmic reticulum lectin 1 [Strongyloides ratti]|uniref:Endoplasmic reticulum lectin 1 n=1 Tax=Strongyloides ratti TaxID=34506 RepID=A0A090LB98_STRRB|nr:Endoplasmic reticulum lectin 1 [Strongyloides ratti]CEF67051.1 Endoplasmic reticulum lectin 1 [Strongyloides ratti]
MIKENNILNFTTPDKEKYLCVLPIVKTEQETKLSSYYGPHPSELIMPLIKEKVCSYLVDVYWSYEVCHGRHIIQYHEDRETKKRDEYYLGNIVFQTPKEKYFDHLNPPKKQIQGKDIPYYSVQYRSGTICDLTGKPRNTSLIYICVEKAKDIVINQVEVSVCQYEIIVATDRLCSHPSFKPPEKKEHMISCFLKEPKDRVDPYPKRLVYEIKGREQDIANELSMIVNNNIKIKVVKQIDNPKEIQLQVDEDVDSDEKKESERFVDFDDKEDYESLANSLVKYSDLPSMEFFDVEDQSDILTEIKLNDDINIFDKLDANEQNTIASNVAKKISLNRIRRNFFNGEQCITGGKGWWRHRFCLESHIEQYHGKPGDHDYKVLNLGFFDISSHIKWVSADKSRLPITDDGKVIQVRQLYVGGNVCDENKQARQTEVRIRCDKNLYNKRSEAIQLFMEEPTQCKYILTIISGTFCNRMNDFIQYGYININNEQIQKDMIEKIITIYNGYSETIRKEGQKAVENKENKINEIIHDDL